MNIQQRAIVAALALGMAASANAADIERPAAVDGTSYTVVAPVYDGNNGSLSYLRLYNGGTASSTFTVSVVNTGTGAISGTANVSVPASASIQYPLTAAGGSNSIMTQAGVTPVAGTGYAVYLRNSDALSGYQHVTYNGATTLFENVSACSTSLNLQQAQNNRLVLTNVHTTALSSYPSTITLHNYAAAAVTVTLRVNNATTGAQLGTFNQTIGANATLSLTSSQIETLAGFTAGSIAHTNVLISNIIGGSLPVRVTQSINNATLGGSLGMTETCAVNAVTTTPTTPTAYCGTMALPYPWTSYFTAAVATNNRIEGTMFGEGTNDYSGVQFSGTVTGTSFSITSSKGTATGTIQNGILSGTLTAGTVQAAMSGSTAACSS